VTVANWTFATEPGFTGFIAGIVQMFYAWRVHVLIKRLYFTLPLVLGALAGTALGIKAAIGDSQNPDFMNWQILFKKFVSAWLGVSALTDIAFATLLVVFLSKRKTGLALTDNVINNVIRNTLQTGLLTAVCAIINLIIFLTRPDRSSLIVNVPLSKIYAISFMSILHGGSIGPQQHTSTRLDHQLTSISPDYSTVTSRYELSYICEDSIIYSTEVGTARNSGATTRAFHRAQPSI